MSLVMVVVGKMVSRWDVVGALLLLLLLAAVYGAKSGGRVLLLRLVVVVVAVGELVEVLGPPGTT